MTDPSVAFGDPRLAILQVEKKVRQICRDQGADPAEGVMLLLTAAAHMSDKYAKGPPSEWVPVLAECLGHAVVAADKFFALESVAPPNTKGVETS